MADIFISYARSDRARRRAARGRDRGAGLVGWWDPAIAAGQQFDDQIDAELQAASAVLVV